MNPIEKSALILSIICIVIVFGGGEYTVRETEAASAFLYVCILGFMAAGLLNKDVTK